MENNHETLSVSNLPFSERLNVWIEERVKDLQYVVGAYPEMSFELFKHTYTHTGFMLISDENCGDTIFGKPSVNTMFRAWHDALHLEQNEGFDYAAEVRVAFAQCAELPKDWDYERMLIMTEVAGQAAYHEKYNKFVPNQRQFTAQILDEGVFTEGGLTIIRRAPVTPLKFEDYNLKAILFDNHWRYVSVEKEIMTAGFIKKSSLSSHPNEYFSFDDYTMSKMKNRYREALKNEEFKEYISTLK